MKVSLKKVSAICAALFMSVLLLHAEKTAVDRLHAYTLDNGLSVFVAENHSAPLVYIEIAVRTGAVAQTAENAGLFHLYEHMMFKGNPKYPNAQAMQRALNDMGVPSWNGTTSTDRVNYFITVPVDQFEKGLEFWSYAVRSPLMDPKEFEDEKKVVLSEIQGYFGQPEMISSFYTSRNLFPEAPWTDDACGSVDVIRNATVSQLKDIQSKYYVPNNAAVLVGGDIDPDEAYRLVKKVYGDWKKGEDPWKDDAKQYSENPLKAPAYCVFPNASVSPQIAQIDVVYRGPDADFNLNDTYVADSLSYVIADPSGAFKKAMLKNSNLQIPDVGNIWARYMTSRRHGTLSFSAIVLYPMQNLPSRVHDFYDTLTKKALPAVQKDKSLDTQKKRQVLIQSIEDSLVRDTETAEGLLATVSYLWCYASRDYFPTYAENLCRVKKADFDSYLEKYIYGRNPMIKVYVNPAVYEQTKDAFDAAGFTEIKAENAFWWSK